MEGEVLTEVPGTLRRLVRYVVRGFYEREHALVMDILIHHPCVKEDDILELLKFERKQLRALINTLKNDKFLKARMRVETDNEGKMTRHNYYFINYSVFVNVVKYKLDHMRRKIETEQRDSANRASYKCPQCEKSFTDLEADQLLDYETMLFLCTFCRSEVTEDASDEPRTDSKSLMVKFNEQLEPLFVLLREVEDIKLADSILEPEPTDIKALRPHGGGRPLAPGEKTTWSGDKSRMEYMMAQNEVTVSMEGEGGAAGAGVAADNKPQKERPVWMMESTVEGAVTEENTMDSVPGSANAVIIDSAASKNNEDIMKTLLAHEKKSTAPVVAGIPVSDEEGSSTSESEDESRGPTAKTLGMPDYMQLTAPAVAEMESEEEEEEEPMVTVAGQQIPYNQVTPDIVAKMSSQEKDAYIRKGQEIYQQMYD